MSCKKRKQCYLGGVSWFCGKICPEYSPTAWGKIKKYFKDVYADLKVWGETWV